MASCPREQHTGIGHLVRGTGDEIAGLLRHLAVLLDHTLDLADLANAGPIEIRVQGRCRLQGTAFATTMPLIEGRGCVLGLLPDPSLFRGKNPLRPKR